MPSAREIERARAILAAGGDPDGATTPFDAALARSARRTLEAAGEADDDG